MFDQKTVEALTEMAVLAGIEPAALLAVTEVESGGRALYRVNGRDEPAIRFEGHYFDRRLTGRLREFARASGLSAPQAGGIANPKAQAARWLLLERAMRLDRRAALESTSWGLGQVMGAHWQWLGYRDIEALVEEARRSIGGQVRLMLRFIEKAGLDEVLHRQDWRAFARRYNGPGFQRHHYDTRLAEAHQRWRDRQAGDAKAA